MNILIWILQGLLGLAFLMAGFGKTFGSTMHKEALRSFCQMALAPMVSRSNRNC